MTDLQLTAIIAAITTLGGGLVAALRWAVQRVTKSNDDGTAALVANTASNAILVMKLDQVVSAHERLADRIDGIGDFLEEHTPVGRIPKPRARTAPQGVGIYQSTPRRRDEDR
jgi:hypothetical protein